MIAVQSALGVENTIKLPESLRSQWGVEEVDYLYAEVKNRNLILRKERSKHTVATVSLTVEKSIIVPKELIKILGIQVGSRVFLSLKDDVVTLHGSKVVDLDSPEQNIDRFAKKIKREFENGQKNPIGMRYEVWLEDIYQFLLLETLDDEIVSGLLNKPNILIEIIRKIRDDEEFNNLLDKKIREKAIECARENE